MLPNETMVDSNNNQVCLFPLEGFAISQAWYDTYSHNPSLYYATDFTAKDSNGNSVTRAPCYAPVDIELLYIDNVEAMALWKSVNQVHFADGSIDYLGLICYHDNDIENNNYFPIGTIKRQGEVFFHTGTGGTATGDHVHLETGKGIVNLNQNRYHFTDNTDCKRIVPDDVLYVNDTYVTPKLNYNWKEYLAPSPTPVKIKSHFKWVLYSRKLKNKWR